MIDSGLKDKVNKLGLIGVQMSLEEYKGYVVGILEKINNNLGTLRIPEGINELRKGNCLDEEDTNRVEGLILPESLNVIGELVSGLNTSIKSLALPSNLRTVEGRAFVRCKALEKVTGLENLEYIGDGAFIQSGLKGEIILGERLVNLEDWAFSMCENIERVDLSKSKVQILRSNTFSWCTKLKEVILPKETVYIRGDCFASCVELEHIEVPDTIRVIESKAFLACVKLKELDLSRCNIEVIKENAFKSTQGMKLILPKKFEYANEYVIKALGADKVEFR